MTRQEIEATLDPSAFIGRSVSQVDSFLQTVAQPIIDRYCTQELTGELKV